VRTFEILGGPEATSSRFPTPRDRAQNMTELYRLMAELTPARTTAEWVQAFRAARIPAMPVTDLADVARDPHLDAVGFFRRRQHPSEGAYIEMQPPIRYSDATAFELRHPPLLGEHNEEIRSELGPPRQVMTTAKT